MISIKRLYNERNIYAPGGVVDPGAARISANVHLRWRRDSEVPRANDEINRGGLKQGLRDIAETEGYQFASVDAIPLACT